MWSLGRPPPRTCTSDRLAGLVLAFFLAVGVGAHALDEYRGRPLGTRISGGYLLAMAAFSIAGAVSIGIVASLAISLWAIAFVTFGTFMVLAYNLELAGGRFHSDLWFDSHGARSRRWWATGPTLNALTQGGCWWRRPASRSAWHSER